MVAPVKLSGVIKKEVIISIFVAMQTSDLNERLYVTVRHNTNLQIHHLSQSETIIIHANTKIRI